MQETTKGVTAEYSIVLGCGKIVEKSEEGWY